MKRYVIGKLNGEMPKIQGAVFDPNECSFCGNAPYAPIESYVWDTSGYKPEARAYVTWSEMGLHVLLCAKESEIRVAATEFNGDVYQDSCLEFFLQPFCDDPRYINFETNAGGVALIGFGTDRHNRFRLAKMPEGMELVASRHDGNWWAVSYIVPNALFAELYGRMPKPGDMMRGNFYKCDESIHPHFGSWAPITYDHPDFHRPEFFGDIEMAE